MTKLCLICDCRFDSQSNRVDTWAPVEIFVEGGKFTNTLEKLARFRSAESANGSFAFFATL